MKRLLYLNCFSGVSGDMLFGALLDLLGEKDPAPFLEGLALDDYEVTVTRSCRKGIAGLDVKVLGRKGHPHRKLSDVLTIMEESDLSPFVFLKASETFRLLAAAEGSVHGMPPEEVHFHEVGAVDSIVDVAGVCALMEALNPDSVLCSRVNVGSGTVECAHGELPVPAPATLKLLEGVPVYSRGEPAERTTPTGAALLRVFAEGFDDMPAGILERSGTGLGDRDTDLPNLLQAILLKGP